MMASGHFSADNTEFPVNIIIISRAQQATTKQNVHINSSQKPVYWAGEIPQAIEFAVVRYSRPVRLVKTVAIFSLC